MIKSHLFVFAIISLLISAIGALAAGQPAPSAASDQNQVTDTVRAMFAAMATDDSTKFRAVTTPDFYAYDVGKRFTGDELMNLIKGALAEGKVYVWSVNEPEVHLHGDLAWITYVNNGSVKDAAGTKSVTWLESAILRKEAGAWRIRFLHSTRVP